MDATNPVDILSAIKVADTVIIMPKAITQPLTYEQAQIMLTNALANVCECYDLPIPGVGAPSDVISFSLLACREAGHYKAMAFGYLARAAMYAASYPEEKAGYPNMQKHLFCALQWAAHGVSNNLARYVLLAIEEATSVS